MFLKSNPAYSVQWMPVILCGRDWYCNISLNGLIRCHDRRPLHGPIIPSSSGYTIPCYYFVSHKLFHGDKNMLCFYRRMVLAANECWSLLKRIDIKQIYWNLYNYILKIGTFETIAMRNTSIPNFTLSLINVNIADLGKEFQAHVDYVWCVNLQFLSNHNDLLIKGI